MAAIFFFEMKIKYIVEINKKRGEGTESSNSTAIFMDSAVIFMEVDEMPSPDTRGR